MGPEEFIARYGGVYEHSAWVAEETFGTDVDPADTDSLARLFAACVDNASRDRKLALIRAHPDLAGRAAIAGNLTDDSSEEQSSAGIDQCTPEEFDQFQSLNSAYKQKFGFPFVMAVRNSKRHDILEAFTTRLKNDNETEFATAISEIHKIARLRLAALENSA